MTEIKHTPEPWIGVQNFGDFFIYTHDGKEDIACVFHEEDARLFAAAPRMYKALKEIAHHPLFNMLSEFDDFRQIQDIAVMALKEVEGE